ncbi:MAG: hypothetical protein GY816_15115, partial [Cytophagales bacterium]|nr:hypothetical protein [Cytophagales bacterium]
MSKRARIIYLTLSALFLFVTLGCVYYLMGGIISGVNDLKVYKQDGITRYVAGVSYKGEPDTKEVRILYEKYRSWVRKDMENSRIKDIMNRGELDDTKRQFNFLSIVNFPTGVNRTIDQFFGVAIRGLSGELPMGDEEVKEVSCEKRYTVFLTMKQIVRPSSESIQEMIYEAAAMNEDEIAFFYETYYSDNSVRIEGFVKE